MYYVTLDGFDTHSRQAPAHSALLRELSQSLDAFVRDLDKHGHGSRVLTMAFSEFCRRLAENASEGTDHGAAAPIFLAGSQVTSGLIGRQPSLSDLEDGDIKFHTDFRQVYATMLDKWLKIDSSAVLDGRFDHVAPDPNAGSTPAPRAPSHSLTSTWTATSTWSRPTPARDGRSVSASRT